MRASTLVFAAAVAFLMSIMSAQAHHSRALFFSDDEGGVVTIEGVISNVRWVNPHFTFTIEATNEGGTIERWDIVSRPASFLHRRGWDAQTMKVGSSIVLIGWKGRSDRLTAWLREMIVYEQDSARLYVEFTDDAIKARVAELDLPGCEPITADCVTLDAATLTTLQREFGEQIPLLFGRVEELFALR